MIKPIIQLAAVSTVPLTLTGRLQEMDVDGIVLRVLTGGTGFTRALFDSITANLTMRVTGGDDIQILAGCRLSDIMRYSDFAGGFSMNLLGDSNSGQYVAFLKLGKIVCMGDDQLEFSLIFPGSTTVTYTVSVAFTDFCKKTEDICGYESIPGNGSEIVFHNAMEIFNMSAANGSQILITDHERSYMADDYLAAAFANAAGDAEAWVDMGVLWADGTGLCQDVRVKLPSGFNGFVKKKFFLKGRQEGRDKAVMSKMTNILNRIMLEAPGKAATAIQSGKMMHPDHFNAHVSRSIEHRKRLARDAGAR